MLKKSSKSPSVITKEPIKKVAKASPSTKPERYVADKKPKEHKEPIRQSTNNNNSVSRVEKKVERERLSDRGIY